MQEFIANGIESALEKQRKYTLFNFAAHNFEQSKSFGFVEWWVIGCLASSVLAYLLSFAIIHWSFPTLVFALLAIRLWEYVPYIFRVTVFTRPSKGQKDIRDPRRTVILLLLNYLVMLFWFAACYSILYSRGSLKFEGSPSPFIATFRESVMSMVANSSGTVTGMSECALTLITFQNVLGLLMTILVVARIISFLPAPATDIADNNSH
jgi:hypothetical protein